MDGNKSIEELVSSNNNLKRKLKEAQARNYELRYKDQPEPTQTHLKGRIDRLEQDNDNLARKVDELSRKIANVR